MKGKIETNIKSEKSRNSYTNCSILLIRHWKKTILFLLIILLLVQGLPWLLVLLLGMTFLYKASIHFIGKINSKIARKMIKGLFLFFFVFITSIGTKLLIGDIYRIPSGSMEDTLLPGDVIFVDKLTYGPKLPRSPFEISWVNLFFYLNKTARKSMGRDWWPHKRLRGRSDMQRGDILIYQLRKDFFVVKRCVAIAGDSLDIRHGKIIVNGKKYHDPATVKNIYKLKFGNRKKTYRLLDSMNINITKNSNERTKRGLLRATLSYKNVITLKRAPEVKSIEIELDTFNLNKNLFAFPRETQWTLDDMKSIVVPKKGMTIILNPFNYDLYKKAIHNHEKVELIEKNGYYYLNGKKTEEYSFNQDYCFVIGDNRKESIDSRYIGFVPKENIIGKVWGILFSEQMSNFRKDRFLKKLSI